MGGFLKNGKKRVMRVGGRGVMPVDSDLMAVDKNGRRRVGGRGVKPIDTRMTEVGRMVKPINKKTGGANDIFDPLS
ncbi:MAG: hypothetical protein GTN97_08615 [Nitrosopumilaceae archaeon]|nr:hypothetical protein [Nitrosopumilaceae archaeon]